MDEIYGGSEIVELGIQIEKNGKDFYNSLYESTKNPKAKDIFKYLAEAEEKHIMAFKEILRSVQNYEPQEAFPQEYFSYMNALASDHVFTQKNKGKELAESVKDDSEAVDLAITFEKDSIIFYDDMKSLVKEHL